MNLKITTLISRILTDLMGVSLTVLAVGLPWLVRWYMGETAHIREMPALWIVLVLGYLAIGGGLFLCSFMRWTLRRVNKGNIFHEPSDWIIRMLGLGCFFEAAVFAALAVWFPVSAVISFAGIFIGVALLVVSEVIRSATALKEENDYTV